MLVLEIANLFLMIQSTTVFDVIKDFLAFTVIADFDDIIFKTMKNDRLAKLITDKNIQIHGFSVSLSELVKIETTSSLAKGRVSALDPIYLDDTNDEPASPYKTREDSIFIKKKGCGRVLYSVLKLFYVSFWFYWGPSLMSNSRIPCHTCKAPNMKAHSNLRNIGSLEQRNTH